MNSDRFHAGRRSTGHARRHFLRQVLGGSLGCTFLGGRSAQARAARIPATGEEDRRLRSFDDLMTSFLDEHAVPGAALAVARQGELVYARGFGYADVVRKIPVQPQALFRIASISKPFTGVTVLQLAEQGKLSLDDRVRDHVRLAPYLEPGAKVDPRWSKITLLQLLQHTGGWDRDKSFDPIGIPWDIAKALHIRPPVRPAHIIRYMLGKPLDFDPGTRYAYSNLGYLLLGRVIEAVTRQPYEPAVRKGVLAPLGITAMQLGRALPEDRPRSEVKYYDAGKRTSACLYGRRFGEQVPLPDGGDNLEGYEAHGGWIASAVDLVCFASAFNDPAKCPLLKEASIATMWAPPKGDPGHTSDGKPREVYYGCGWNVRPIGNEGKVNAWHTGLIGGTSTLLVHRFDNLAWAVLFNTDRDGKGKVLSGVIDPLVHDATAAVRSWPEGVSFAEYRKQHPA
jgi:N-acyl-D-amino-acid deacylase